MKHKIGSNKSFGIVFCIVFFLIGIWPILNNGNFRFWAIAISLIFLVLGMINSKILSPLNKAWFQFGVLLGKVITPIILGIIFFLVVTPIGIMMRMLNRDLLNLRFNSNKSYWIEKTNQKSKMKNQF